MVVVDTALIWSVGLGAVVVVDTASGVSTGPVVVVGAVVVPGPTVVVVDTALIWSVGLGAVVVVGPTVNNNHCCWTSVQQQPLLLDPHCCWSSINNNHWTLQWYQQGPVVVVDTALIWSVGLGAVVVVGLQIKAVCWRSGCC